MPETPSHSSEDLHSRFELKALIDTSTLLIESRDVNFVLNNLLFIVMGKLLVTKAAILLFDSETKNYRVEKTKGRTTFAEGDHLELNWDASQTEQSVIELKAEDVDTPDVLGKNNLCMVFNLRTGDNHLGYLCLGPKANGEPLLKREIEFIGSLATISAVAMSNTEMVEELKHINRQLDRRVYELNTLFDLSKDFNVLIDRSKIIRIFKFAMLGQMLIRQFFMILERGEERTIVSQTGMKGEPDQDSVDAIFEMGEDIVHSQQITQADIPYLSENGIEALIALNFQGERAAMIGVGPRANGDPYSDSDFNFLSSLGNLALLSIQKTFLLEERIEKERIEEELNIAKSIQEGLLPHPLPEFDGVELAATNISSRQVGGDYFDALQTPQGNYLFAIADVTGKGTPAALLMANLQAMLQALAPLEISLADATARINDIIHKNTPSDKFITFFWASYHPEQKQLTFVNAGHNPPLLFRKGESDPIELEDGGLLLGAMPTMAPYEEGTQTMEAGDLVVSFTDGVSEAMSPDEEEYGEERLIQCIQKNLSKPPEEILTAITDDVDRFTEGVQFDDVTLLILRIS